MRGLWWAAAQGHLRGGGGLQGLGLGQEGRRARSRQARFRPERLRRDAPGRIALGRVALRPVVRRLGWCQGGHTGAAGDRCGDRSIRRARAGRRYVSQASAEGHARPCQGQGTLWKDHR